jgi:hypothetical protein
MHSLDRVVRVVVGAGKSDHDIAAALFISPKTASVHVSNAKAKLGVSTRLEAALWVRERGLIEDDANKSRRTPPRLSPWTAMSPIDHGQGVIVPLKFSGNTSAARPVPGLRRGSRPVTMRRWWRTRRPGARSM